MYEYEKKIREQVKVQALPFLPDASMSKHGPFHPKRKEAEHVSRFDAKHRPRLA
jgi:hypothetical protein